MNTKLLTTIVCNFSSNVDDGCLGTVNCGCSLIVVFEIDDMITVEYCVRTWLELIIRYSYGKYVSIC